ncbi:MAG TPA: hypothetical protein VGJ74_01865 [Burkholderiales bacterium]|jgi:hypothetical protein
MFAWALEIVATQAAEAANEPWLAFPPRQDITITRLGEYTRIVLTKCGVDIPPSPLPEWA